MSRQSKPAYEERTGTYEIDHLDIDVGNETIRLQPKGTSVIGARGRIDMSRLGFGDSTLFLILSGSYEKPDWSIVDRSVRTRLTALTKENFEAALENLLDGYGYGIPSEFAM